MTARAQATVRTWSEDGGSAFLDDGTVVDLPADAVRRGPFRFLRPGQRVALELDGETVQQVGLP